MFARGRKLGGKALPHLRLKEVASALRIPALDKEPGKVEASVFMGNGRPRQIAVEADLLLSSRTTKPRGRTLPPAAAPLRPREVQQLPHHLHRRGLLLQERASSGGQWRAEDDGVVADDQ